MKALEREWVSNNPESQIAEDIDHLTRRARSARELLRGGESGDEFSPVLPSPPTTTGPSHNRAVSAYHTRNNAAGKCAYCPRPLAPNSVHYCVEHLELKRERKRKRREEFKTRLRAGNQPSVGEK